MAISRRGVTSTTPLNAPAGGTTTTTVTYPGLSLPGDIVMLIVPATLRLTDLSAPPAYTIDTGTTRVVPNPSDGWTLLGDHIRAHGPTAGVADRLSVWSKVRGSETTSTVVTGTNSNTNDGTLRQSRLLEVIAWRGAVDNTVHNYGAQSGDSGIGVSPPDQTPTRAATMGVIALAAATSLADRSLYTIDAGGIVNTNSTVIVSNLHRDVATAGLVSPIPSTVGTIMASFLLYPDLPPTPSGWVRTGSAILGNATRVGWS